jgi:hypothetical protein
LISSTGPVNSFRLVTNPLTELTDISIGANSAALLLGLWLGFLLLAYVALVKTSSAPSGTSRFPRNELFVPTMVISGAAQPLPQNELSLPRQQLGQVHEVSSVAHASSPANLLPSSAL